MRVVALIAVRNEALYIRRCLMHLQDNGVDFCVIDNESNDETLAIVQEFSGRGLVNVVSVPYEGHYDWIRLLKVKSELARDIQADWFIHQDADEILEAPDGVTPLRSAIAAVDECGDNVINFDEFVFVPSNERDEFEGKDYVAEMRNYYFFEPQPVRLLRAWSSRFSVDLAISGGHHVQFENRKIHPVHFPLRHYITLSMNYLKRKYISRTYSEDEVKRLGWHGWRAEFSRWNVAAPPASSLKTLSQPGGWDRSEPKAVHQFLVERA